MSDLLTPAELAAIAEREAKATAGPWAWRGTAKGWYLCCVNGLRSYVIDCFMGKLRVRDFKRDLMVEFNPFHPDAIFIAHARTDIHALLRHIAALEARTKETSNAD